MKKSIIQQLTDDKGIEMDLPYDYYHHICCDCGLTHQIFVEKVGKNKIRLCFVRDDALTRDYKKLEKCQKQNTTKKTIK